MRTILLIAATIRTAISEVAGNSGALLRALVFPATIIFLTDIAENQTQEFWGSEYVFGLVTLVFYSLYAVICHRVILLDKDSLQSRWGLFLTAREIRFTGWLVAIGLLTSACIVVPFALATFLMSSVGPSLLIPSLYLVVWVGIIPATYFNGRFAMVLPGTAIDRRLTLAESWQLTSGHGYWITGSLLVPVAAWYVIDIIFYFVFAGTGETTSAVLYSAVFFPTMAIEIAILSILYRRLTSNNDAQQGNSEER